MSCLDSKNKFEYVYTIAYNRDENEANFEKHGVWFDEARTIWADPHGLEAFDPDHNEDEDRYLRIGVSTLHKTILVVFCEREGGQKIRIISARKATAREREQYEKGI